MLKILYNEDCQATRDEGSIKFTISGAYVKVEMLDSNGNVVGFDVIRAVRSYSSYALIHTVGKVKVFRKMYKSNYKILDLNRLGVAIREDFANIVQLYGDYDIMQLDSGIISPTHRDMIIRVFTVHKDNIEVKADQDYTLEPFSSKALEFGDHPRFHLWDSYALEVNGRELKANRKGRARSGDFATPIVCTEGQDYMELTIRKYKGAFDGDALTRDEDCEEVLIEATAGILNTRRVRLDHGVAKIRLYPFGYTGETKIKLGRKWYEVWNEYNLVMGESK